MLHRATPLVHRLLQRPAGGRQARGAAVAAQHLRLGTSAGVRHAIPYLAASRAYKQKTHAPVAACGHIVRAGGGAIPRAAAAEAAPPPPSVGAAWRAHGLRPNPATDSFNFLAGARREPGQGLQTSAAQAGAVAVRQGVGRGSHDPKTHDEQARAGIRTSAGLVRPDCTARGRLLARQTAPAGSFEYQHDVVAKSKLQGELLHPTPRRGVPDEVGGGAARTRARGIAAYARNGAAWCTRRVEHVYMALRPFSCEIESGPTACCVLRAACDMICCVRRAARVLQRARVSHSMCSGRSLHYEGLIEPHLRSSVGLGGSPRALFGLGTRPSPAACAPPGRRFAGDRAGGRQPRCGTSQGAGGRRQVAAAGGPRAVCPKTQGQRCAASFSSSNIFRTAFRFPFRRLKMLCGRQFPRS